MNRFILTFALIFALFLIGCNALGGAGEPTAELPTVVVPAATIAVPTAEPPTALPPTAEPAPTGEPAPTATPEEMPLSFEPTTYRHETFGFEFDYPSDWTVLGQRIIGDRGSAVQFLPAGGSETDIAMQLTFYLWDPKGDLPAYVDHRKTAWTASGLTLLSEQDQILNGDHPAVSYVFRTQEGEETFFFLTVLGDRYLEMSGDYDPKLLAEIAGTLRFFEPEASSEAAAALGCLTVAEDTAEWVACNVMDGIRSRNLAALLSFMADPFVIGYWGSEGRSAAPEEIIAELRDFRLPADPAATPLTFTTDPDQFPALQGIPAAGILGPDLNVVHVIYSEGWGPDGQGAALLYIAQDSDGNYFWPGLVYSDRHFDN